MEMLRPLRDDVAVSHSKWQFWWLDFFDHHHAALIKTLQRQVQARPTVWNVGLWPDEKTESVARTCADIFEDACGLTGNFIPDDPMWLIARYDDDLGPIEAIQAIEASFNCELSNEQLDQEPNMTFRRFVEIVMSREGTGHQKKKSSKSKFAARSLWLVWLGCMVAFLLWRFLR